MRIKILFFILSIFFIQINLFASIDLSIENVATDSEDFTMWIALFGLGLVSLFALFLSSEQTQTFKKKYEQKEKEEQEAHKAQDNLISKIGEDIYDIAKDKKSLQSETQLLAITTNLIEFLKIKSKKVTIVNEELKISNLLNDVSGTLKSNIKDKELELLYNINSDLSKYMISDTLNLSKILTNILIYCVEKDAEYITLDIDLNSVFSKDDQLFFTINSHLKIDAESEDNIFDSKYNEETDSYESLGLFIAKELSLLMNGDLIARNDAYNNLEFVFNIPYKESLLHKEKSLKNGKKPEIKNILVIESSEKSAEHIKNMLIHLNNRVKVINQKEYLFDLPIFHKYDIIFMEENLFADDAMMELQKIETQIVATYNIFQKAQEFENSKIADMKVSKPLTIWQLSDILEELSKDKIDKELKAKRAVVNSGNVLVHRNSFQMTRNVTLSKFVQFKDKKVLLVEDNLINQKVFLGILGKSKMSIEVANNGQEALDILKKDRFFDIIFMDINMPVMDGYTATKKIREEARYDDIPIVALSALTSNDEIAKMFTSGMNGYIAKPLKKEILFTVFLIFIENTTVPHAKDIEADNNTLSKLDGLNIELGISKSAYNEIFYKEILIEFKDAYQTSDQQFKKLLNDFRYEQLRILCLDIKGLSGTIGAENIHKLITEIIKKIILKKYDTIPELIAEYEVELKRVNASIDKYLSL